MSKWRRNMVLVYSQNSPKISVHKRRGQWPAQSWTWLSDLGQVNASLSACVFIYKTRGLEQGVSRDLPGCEQVCLVHDSDI